MARRAVEERLGDVLSPPLVDDAKLLVSEVVTNSVQHAELEPDGWIELTVRMDPASGVTRIEVSDSGSGFDGSLTAPSLLALGGRGLYLVEQLALRWGVSTDTTAVVWFELPLDRR